MSKKQKLIERLLTKPKDFSYDEVRSIFSHLGFTEETKGKTSGSRVEFVKEDMSILLHKPHPDGIMKHYQITQIIDFLQDQNLV